MGIYTFHIIFLSHLIKASKYPFLCNVLRTKASACDPPLTPPEMQMSDAPNPQPPKYIQEGSRKELIDIGSSGVVISLCTCSRPGEMKTLVLNFEGCGGMRREEKLTSHSVHPFQSLPPH
jgi:hypothetical protein